MHTSVVHAPDLESHLRREDEFVALEEAARGVQVDRICERVNQVLHALSNIGGCGGTLDCLLENHAERLHSNIIRVDSNNSVWL